MHASLRNVAIAGAFVSLFFHACSDHSTGFATDGAATDCVITEMLAEPV